MNSRVSLRPYQEDLVHRVRGAYRAGARSVLLQLATGGGKTVIFSHISASITKRQKRVLVLVHRRELIRQASAKLDDAGVRHGVIAPGYVPTDDRVQLASVQTLARRLNLARGMAPDLLVIDETHHAVAGQWASIIEALPTARLLGVTATPERLDGRGLGVSSGGPFDALVEGPPATDLIRGGYLTRARVFAPADALDLASVRSRGGDWDPSALAEMMSKPRIVGSAVAHYAEHAAGLPAVLFSPTVSHAEDMARAFRKARWRSVVVSGTTPVAERDAAIAGLADGSVQVLCSCDVISEGLDVPVIGAAILMRPTRSLGLFLQQAGRGLRPSPGKDALIVLDHAGNALRHGLPDSPRVWSLDGKERRAGRPASDVRQCPECGAVHAVAPECPECGHVYTGPSREAEELDGRLREVERARIERIQELRRTPLSILMQSVHTREQIAEVALARGYGAQWVDKILSERARVRGAAA